MFKWLFGKKSILKSPAPEVDRTFVDCRKLMAPTKYWTSQVYYDAWGTPYIYDHYDLPSLINKNGSIVTPGNAQWRHKSGPPVTFPPGDLSYRQAHKWAPSDD